MCLGISNNFRVISELNHLAMSVATAIHMKVKRYIGIFRKAGATNPTRAINPSEHGIRKSLVFGKLVRQGVIVSVDDTLYYLDEEREAAHAKRRHAIVTVVLVVIVVAIIAGAFLLK